MSGKKKRLCQVKYQRLCQVKNIKEKKQSFLPGGKTFDLEHNGDDACGIPDKETIVMTGGYEENHVTR